MNPLPAERLTENILAFVQRATPRESDAAFDALAGDVFAYQYQHNEPYRRFCNRRGVTPATIRTGKSAVDATVPAWREIPAVPVAAYKRFVLSSTSPEDCLPERGGAIFHSSGTTGTETSKHYMNASALSLYRATLRAGYERFVLPDTARLPVFALMPSPQDAPHSSLSFMLGETMAEYGGAFFWGDDWHQRLAVLLREVQEPVVLFGTAFAYVQFLDGVSQTFALPEGSRVVETGGFKGRSREVARDELYTLFTERLGVPTTHSVSEYGMSELASQYYDSTLRDWVFGQNRTPRKVPSSTLRTRILDPVTGTDTAPGQPGLLTHYDVANLNSVLAVQTEDMGVWAEDGDGFYLLGRAPGAVLRGCSLLAE